MYRVALGPVRGAHIDAVRVVGTAADRVEFDEEVAHGDGAKGEVDVML